MNIWLKWTGLVLATILHFINRKKANNYALNQKV